MSIDIKIRKGLNLRLKGAAPNMLKTAPASTNYAINPTDFHGVFPKLVCKEGTFVQAGQPLFFSKYQESVQFVSPVSGTVKEIKRGAKRKVLEIVISADKKQQSVKHKLPALDKITPEQVKELLLASGNWPFIKQRPYDIVADPNATPKAIFISALATAPLSAQFDVILEGQQDAFQTGIDILSKLSPNLHLSVGAQESSQIAETKNCTIHRVKGPHPAGNVGVQIHHIDPINASETVWVVGAEDVANIGRFFQTGVFDASRTLAVVGHPLSTPCYFKSKVGASLAPILEDVGAENLANLRVINGDVLTGTATSSAGYVGYYNNTVSVLPEGDRYRMFGWLPFAGPNIHSISNTSLSWLFPKRQYTPDTNLNGEERALVVTGEMERVFPMDIYPMQLLKACMANDIEKMEQLGIYEVAPEDFALIDYANSSKIEAQAIIRDALDLMYKEVG
ncbi:MAG: Na(+)-translocating NADH-quinone reductase subunit A [Bacteroidota bacterium]|nr:Na(+)-translocating NADH-quinone reductase subunit A [Bacteroidota bacterium]